MKNKKLWTGITAVSLCIAMACTTSLPVLADNQLPVQELKQGSTQWDGYYTASGDLFSWEEENFFHFRFGREEQEGDRWIPNSDVTVQLKGRDVDTTLTTLEYIYGVLSFEDGTVEVHLLKGFLRPGDYTLTVNGSFTYEADGSVDDITVSYPFQIKNDKPETGSTEWDGNYEVTDTTTADKSTKHLRFVFGKPEGIDPNMGYLYGDIWTPTQNVQVMLNGETIIPDSNKIEYGFLPGEMGVHINCTAFEPGEYTLGISGTFYNEISDEEDEITVSYPFTMEEKVEILSYGWHKAEGGGWFWVEEDGSIKQNGWVEDKGFKYYIEDGVTLYNQWKYMDGGWRYFNKWGVMYDEYWYKIGDFYYHFTNGIMDENKWIRTKSYWSYVDQYGHAYAGNPRWAKINGKYYAFNEWGNMYANTYIGKYYVNKSGAWDPRYDKKS